ncbi:retropepsin-like aspartic protease [Cronbergia sp. UHCC 0137]|uniref:retropepsin-like aspartic protease family protein n=1 Tax=Cronbergia sp. UHCC 0137 TaxID=3110239 RepID=UPI002B1F07FB|nr:retropepsin-like aspartic protease [Cronbergia sp. UHCC 0137]MEA5620648.1 retropepsin-like aspartic protease [Cronbergia sp. UHCC 0137]
MKDASQNWIMTKKMVVVSLIPTVIFAALSHRVVAEDPGICFMVTSSGKTVSLGKLCGAKTKSNSEYLIQKNKNISHISSLTKLSEGKVGRIPIKRRIGKTPVIEVTFNNNQTFDMILDTGANGTLITRGMANQLKVKTTGTMRAQIADGSQIKFSTGQVKSMAAGGVVANNIEVAIAPKGGIGLLGHDFFGNYDIKLSATDVEFHQR